jgi:hypothetical protein
MYRALPKAEEIRHLRQNIHRIVFSLEECCFCLRVCECELSYTPEGSAAWSCAACQTKRRVQLLGQNGRLAWPFRPAGPSGERGGKIPMHSELSTPEDNLSI